MKYEALNLLDLLKEKNIIYQLFEHEPFFTVEESSKLKIDLNMQGAHTKNLFLRDKKRNFYLISCLDNQEIFLILLNLFLDGLGKIVNKNFFFYLSKRDS